MLLDYYYSVFRLLDREERMKMGVGKWQTCSWIKLLNTTLVECCPEIKILNNIYI